MSHVRVDVTAVRICLYSNPVDATIPLSQMRQKYDEIMWGQILDNGICRISGVVNARLVVRNIKSIAVKLQGMGVHRVEWRHNGHEQYYNIGG